MPDDWQQYQGTIVNLYQGQNKTCDEVRKHMKNNYGFVKSRRSTPGPSSPYGDGLSPNRPAPSPLNSNMDTDEPPSSLIANVSGGLPGPIPSDAENFFHYFDDGTTGSFSAYSPGGQYLTPPDYADFPLAPGSPLRGPNSHSPGYPLVPGPTSPEPWAPFQRGDFSLAGASESANFEGTQLSIQTALNPYTGPPEINITPAEELVQDSQDLGFPGPDRTPDYLYGYNNARPPRSGGRGR
ncbi:hypothetical protein SAPIO_CDS9331 [Scedosporium apiospermum]|uniref:Clr5 domain-containing protein n=1 Tax=Pseudallescheria apiosperma TaxID=563466 RepID=A0A084FWK4_PSEDA|nr:uncharacterized protein SAPIO_CDS9331 [Scedosporium apiospermum]KEZ39466.1 hypothetical protein SAPIO_CDS9331 [Scedosporium apiospermum]